MKTIFRFLSVAVVLAGIGATSAKAQDACANVDDQTVLYTKVTDNYAKKDVASKKIAVEAGKQFLEKYGACETLKDQVTFVKAQVPIQEGLISKIETGAAFDAMFARFDAGIKGEKYDDVYAAGKDILSKQPDNLNVLIPLGMIGLYQSYAKNFKYNDDSLRYAQQAVAAIKSGKEFPKKNKAGVPVAGAFQFECAKEDCLSDLTYAQGYINYYAKNDKKTALPFYYDVAQMPGRNKNEPRVYATIGSGYYETAGGLGREIADLITKQKAAKTDEEKVALDVQIKAKIAMFNGYLDRTLDAYGRAYTVAKSDTPANKTYRDTLYKILQEAYKSRFDKTEGLDAYVSSTVAKPLPNPMTEVTPVVEAEPVKTTGSVTMPATPAVDASAVTAPKAATTAVKTAATTTAVTPAATAKTPAAAPAKKIVAVKKKGTR